MAVSTNEKKKGSDPRDDSKSIPEDVLQALADASAEDEAEFLDALSDDVEEEMQDKETVIDSIADLKQQGEVSDSKAFPEVGLNEAEKEDTKSPFDLSSPFDESEDKAVEQSSETEDEYIGFDDEGPPELDPPEVDSLVQDTAIPDLPEDSSDDPHEEGPEETVDIDDAMSNEETALDDDFLSHDDESNIQSDVLTQDELDNLSEISTDLDEAVANSDFSDDEISNPDVSPDVAAESAPEPPDEVFASAKDSNDDQTEMLQENDFPTMAVGQVKMDENNQQSSGRNPLIDLKNADYIKFAQDKIKNLEKQLFDLRAECEELARAGDHFKNLADERGQKVKNLEAKVDELESLSSEEKKILQESLSSKDLRINTMQEHIENLEQELESRYNRVRVRERDLEGRLEILKKEQFAVAKSKDEMILKLKSQNEGIKSDLEKLRAQSQKVTSHLQDKEDALRRTMKALKLSLTMLESQSKD